MQGPNSILEKEFVAEGALVAFRIGKKGAAEDQVVPAAAVGDNVFGVIQHDAADTERVRLMLIGISKVEMGGTVAQGDRLTTDASGRAVTSALATDSIIGIAMSDSVIGDIGTVLLAPAIV